MHFTVQVVIDDDQGKTTSEDIIQFDKQIGKDDLIGLSLLESKHILKHLQNVIVSNQADHYARSHKSCPHCQKNRQIKDTYWIQYRTLFGIVSLPSQRLYHCDCTGQTTKTFSVLKNWLPEHNSPELQYIETKWASLMSYKLATQLMKEVLPVNEGLNAETVRKHLHKVAKRQEKSLQGKPVCISGCAYEWGKLPKPDKPLTVGIDGGYVKDWYQKKTDFEVIVAKSLSKTNAAKRLGFVQKIEDNPRRKLLSMLTDQGMQENQQITFLSDGADNVRELQYLMHPESEHVLDWFHVTMRLSVLNQFAKGLSNSDPECGEIITKDLESTKWYLWHGNVEKALDKIDGCCSLCDGDELYYVNRKKFYKYLCEMVTYISNNRYLIPNYGEKYRYGETISTAFVESTVNEVIAKRMVKKQQMQWSPEGAHYLLQTRTAVLNNELRNHFEDWYPELKIKNAAQIPSSDMKKAA